MGATRLEDGEFMGLCVLEPVSVYGTVLPMKQKLLPDD